MIDIFNNDAFSMVSLTQAINKLPYKPSRLTQMNVFEDQPVNTITVVIEERDGLLNLLPTKQRGAPASELGDNKRRARPFSVPHIPLERTIRPEDVQGVREFGSDNQLATVATVVNNKLTEMRQSFEVTWEFHKMGAAKGLLLDADGTTVIYNLFTEFGVTQDTVDFTFGTTTTSIRNKIVAVKRLIESALGIAMYDHIHCFCGDTWFDSFVSHPDVKAAYDKYLDGAVLRTDLRAGFEFAGVVFENYRGAVSGVDFMNDAEANFFPVGVPGLFKQHWAPGDFMETANTLGMPMYAKQEVLPLNRGVRLHSQSNPLMLCTRPKVLVKGTTSN